MDVAAMALSPSLAEEYRLLAAPHNFDPSGFGQATYVGSLASSLHCFIAAVLVEFICVVQLVPDAVVDLSLGTQTAVFYSIIFPLLVCILLGLLTVESRCRLYIYYRLLQYGHLLVFEESQWKVFLRSSVFVFFALSTGVLLWAAVATHAYASIVVIATQTITLLTYYLDVYRVESHVVSLNNFVRDEPHKTRQLLLAARTIDAGTLRQDCCTLDWLRDQIGNALERLQIQHAEKETLLKAFWQRLNLLTDFAQVGLYHFPHMDLIGSVPRGSPRLSFIPPAGQQPLEQWTLNDWENFFAAFLPLVNSRLAQLSWTTRANAPFTERLNRSFSEPLWAYASIVVLDLLGQSHVNRTSSISSAGKAGVDRAFRELMKRVFLLALCATICVEIYGFYRAANPSTAC